MVSFTDHYNAISTDRLPLKTKIEKFHGTLITLFYASPSYKDFSFFIRNPKKTTTLQQVIGKNTPNLVLKRMLRFFLKIPPLKKILQFQDRICSFY